MVVLLAKVIFEELEEGIKVFNTNSYISIVIPVYGCGKCLDELHRRLVNILQEITYKYEIILVNDYSPDNSWDYIKKIVDSDPNVKGIKLSRNFGQHYAITAGLDHSNGEWVVVMDCDLQDQPEEIEKLYRKAMEGYDIVLGRRQNRQDSFFKKLGSKIFYKTFGYLTDTRQDGTVANFGIYNRKVINTLTSMRENLRFFPTMVKWVGYSVASIDIEHANRASGKSSYSLIRLIRLALDVIIAFSDKPLRISVKLGLTMSFVSFLYALFIVCRALLGIKGIEGWSSLIVSIWFLAGLIIFNLGIVGVYIGKIFDEVKRRPLYIVGEIYEQKSSNVFDESEGVLCTKRVY